MDISVWIQAFNEEHNLERLFKPLKDIKDIVLVDHESTDNTAVLAKKLGARVYTLPYPHDIVKKEDIETFTHRFGYEPRFKIGDKIGRAWESRTQAQAFCKNDWVLNLDCDEVLTWNYKKVKKILPLYDVINCKFYHLRTPEGKRTDWFQTSKLYKRSKVFWIGRIHEVIDGYDKTIGWSDDMEIDHLQTLSPNRIANINALEYAVIDNQEIRSQYYLGKEYYHWGFFDKAIKLLTIYLKEAFYHAEKTKSYIMIADSLYQMGKVDEAFVYATQALKVNPNSQEAYLQLAKMDKSKEEVWLRHAEIAENDHLL